jgi:hypothetical protein
MHIGHIIYTSIIIALVVGIILQFLNVGLSLSAIIIIITFVAAAVIMKLIDGSLFQ